MPYGHPTSTGHGHRAPHYRWSPSFDPASSRRRSKSRPSSSRKSRPAPSPLVAWDKTDGAFQGGHFPNWAITLLGFLLTLTLLVHFPFLLIFFLKPLLEGGFDTCINEAEESMLSSMDKMSKTLRIHRKTSVEPPPTPEAIRAAWAAARRSLMGKLLAGTLLSNLEPVVDQSYIRDEDGKIVGRRAGIKGWLTANCPDMLAHYKALMSYKVLADKLRMTLSVEEPDTLSGIIDFEKAIYDNGLNGNNGCKDFGEIRVCTDIRLAKSNREDVVKNVSLLNDALRRTGRAGSAASLDAVLREQLGLPWMRRGRRVGKAA